MLRMTYVAAMIVMAATTGVHSQDEVDRKPRGLFDHDSVLQTLTDAGKQHKLAFVAIYSPDCNECKASDEHTFSDTAVRNWLSQKTVSVKLMSDTEEGAQFVAAHNILEFPTFVFLKPDGMKQGIIIGHLEPRAFFARAQAIIKGDSADSLSAASISVWSERFEKGRTYLEEGKNVEALDTFIWALDYPPAHDPMFANERLQTVIEEMIALSHTMPEARRELLQRRDRAQAQILKTEAPLIIPMRIVQYVNQGLGLEEDSVQLLDELRKKYPGGSNVDILSRLFYDQLLKARRYELLYGAATYSTNQAVVQEGQKSTADAQNAIKVLAERYEILAGMGLGNEARDAATAVFSLDNSPETFELMAAHAIRSGKSFDDAQGFVNESIKRVGKELPRHTVLKAQIKSGQGSHDEAIAMLEKAMESATDDESLVLYGNALDALKQEGPPSSGHRIPKQQNPDSTNKN